LVVLATNPKNIYWPSLSFQFVPQPEKRQQQCFNAVQSCFLLFNACSTLFAAMHIRLGLKLCIGSLCYQPQEDLLAESEPPIRATAREGSRRIQ
jgi:hypothetical protein